MTKLQREVKFRAWDPHSKTMVKNARSILIRLTGELEYEFSEDKLSPCGSPDLIIMQYTGLKDKNGVEIYEGDVLNAKGYGRTYRVCWEGGSFYCYHTVFPKLRWGLLSRIFETDIAKDSDFSVIGNVHEHPELLQ